MEETLEQTKSNHRTSITGSGMLSFSGGGGGVGGLVSCSGSGCGTSSGTGTMVGGGEDGTECLLNPTDAASVAVENRCEGF